MRLDKYCEWYLPEQKCKFGFNNAQVRAKAQGLVIKGLTAEQVKTLFENNDIISTDFMPVNSIQ